MALTQQMTAGVQVRPSISVMAGLCVFSVAVCVWLSSERGGDLKANAPVPASTQTEGGSNSGAPSSTQSQSPAKPREIGQRPALSYFQERFQIRAADGFRLLASNPDPLARVYAIDILLSCGMFADNTFAVYQKMLIDDVRRPPQVKKQQLEMAARQRRRCEGISAADLARRSQLVAELISQKYPGVVSRLQMTSANKAEVLGTAQTAAATQDPVILRDVGMFFAQRPDAQQLDFDLGFGQMANGSTIRDAWFLASCQFGIPCDRDDMVYVGKCMNGGWCDQPSLEQTLLDHSYSPADAQVLILARDVIARGIRTGQWPDHFWSGVRRSESTLRLLD